MNILVVGSVGYDTVWTPMGSGVDLLGGSATFFALSASRFAHVSMVAVVGDDFLAGDRKLLETSGINISGLEVGEGKTFRWEGRYGPEDMNVRETVDTQLNVFAQFKPTLSQAEASHELLFLGNIDPELQLSVLGQMARRPKLVAADTMNFWIEGKRDALSEVVAATDVLFMDEGEVRSFACENNLVKAARLILSKGPTTLIAKRGEHGVLVVGKDSIFAAPAYPLEAVMDPTGAGDSFAGGFMGYLATSNESTEDAFRRAAIVGSVMGSFAVERLSIERLESLTYSEMINRFRSFSKLTSFPALTPGEDLPWRPLGS